MDVTLLLKLLNEAANDPRLRAELAAVLGMLFEDTVAAARTKAAAARGQVQTIDDALQEFMKTGEVPK